MHFLQAINSDLSVLTVCNKTGGTIKGDIKKKKSFSLLPHLLPLIAYSIALSLAVWLLTVQGSDFQPLKFGTWMVNRTSGLSPELYLVLAWQYSNGGLELDTLVIILYWLSQSLQTKLGTTHTSPDCSCITFILFIYKGYHSALNYRSSW